MNHLFDKKILDELVAKIKREQRIQNMHFERFKTIDFKSFVEKVKLKYSGAKYRNRWFKRGFEPPEHLFWFLFHFAKKFGRPCSDAEWQTYSNDFTSDLYYYDGYYFNRMDGQGSLILIIKEGDF